MNLCVSEGHVLKFKLVNLLSIGPFIITIIVCFVLVSSGVMLCTGIIPCYV